MSTTTTAPALTVAAVLSLLHEPADRNSATRLFRGVPVLHWTLDRLARAKSLSHIAVLCWEDQLPAVVPAADDAHVDVLAKGPRHAVPALDRLTAARKWADGWRGGLFGTCDFDAGFHAAWTLEVCDKLSADAVLLVPPSSGLVDPELVDRLIAHATDRRTQPLVFSPAAPGLGGAILRKSLLKSLAVSHLHPGRFLHYLPEDPHLDPVSGEGCCAVPAAVARTTDNFRLDSDRRVARLTSAFVSLNGSLAKTGGEDLARRLATEPSHAPLPREVTLEITTTRTTNPLYWPGRHLQVARRDMTPAQAEPLLAQLATADDARLTIGGVGDPLRSPHLWEILALAQDRGVHALHVETDLAEPDESLAAKLAASGADVVTVFLPALTPQTYAAVMGVDAYARVLNNLKVFVTERQRRTGGGVPLLAPTFVKLAANLAELDTWYDQWLSAVGSAVIVGPTDCGGQIPNVSLADMQPPKRRACARIQRRLTVLSDGRVVPCEQDVLGKQTLGTIGRDALSDIWRRHAAALRTDHDDGHWAKHPVCAACKEWFRT
jgi:radical SAM protein with 4Fe4S-binding SPASM domain